VTAFNSHPKLATVAPLLLAANLPTVDLTPAHLEHFFTTGPQATPTGLVGLEIYGPNALLRSLVVDPSARAQGLGSALVAHIEQYARERDVRSIYLLTTTAEAFFERQGYRSVDRELAPPAIRATPEFAGLCPASSAFMAKAL